MDEEEMETGEMVSGYRRMMGGEDAREALPPGTFTRLTSNQPPRRDETSSPPSPTPRSGTGTIPKLPRLALPGSEAEKRKEEKKVSVVGRDSRGSREGRGSGRGSRRSGGRRGEKGRGGKTRSPTKDKESEAFATQEQIRVFIAKIQALQAKERDLRKTLVEMRREMKALEVERAAMGGREAVKRNARHLEHARKVLERRITKAKEDRMRAKGENQELRAEIDSYRREKLALQNAVKRLEKEVSGLQDKTKEKLSTIAATEERTRDLEARLVSVLERSRAELREMEVAWEGLDRKTRSSRFTTKLPTPRGAEDAAAEEERLKMEELEVRKEPKHVARDIYDIERAGGREEMLKVSTEATTLLRASAPRKKEKKETGVTERSVRSPATASRGGTRGSSRGGTRGKKGGALTRTRWRSAFLQARVSHTEGKLSSLKAVFEQVQEMTGVKSVEEFADRFVQMNEENHALFQRCDTLAAEADGLRKQILEARAESRALALRQRVEDGERRVMLTHVDTAIAATEGRYGSLEEEKESLERVVDALDTGIGHLMEALDLVSETRAIREAGGETARALGALMQEVQGGVNSRLTTFSKLRGDVALLDGIRARVASASDAVAEASATGNLAVVHEAANNLHSLLASLQTMETARRKSSKSSKKHLSRRAAAKRAAAKHDKGTKAMSRAERRGSVDLSVLEVRRALLAAAQEGDLTTLMTTPTTSTLALGSSADPSAAESGTERIVPLRSLVVGPDKPTPTVVVRTREVVEQQAAAISN